MSQERARWWAALMLSGFVLRSFIPVGFMPMVGSDHRLRLVVCEGYAPLPWAAASMPMDMSGAIPMNAATGTAQHRHAETAAHRGAGHPIHRDHGNCPYGCSPALGALPAPEILAATVPLSPEPAAASPQVEYFAVPPRAQSPRGPPA